MVKTGNEPKTPAAASGSAEETATNADSGPASQSSAGADAPQPKDAIELLKADHRLVESLFTQYETASEDQKPELIHKVCSELVIHTIIEEEIFYPACREAAPEDEPLNEAQVEHDSAKTLISDLMNGRRDDPYRDAKLKVLAEQIKHHVGEEEAPAKGIFAKARANGVDIVEVGQRLKQRKQQLQALAGSLRPSHVVSLQPIPRSSSGQPQEEPMARQYSGYDRDRDERGRFVSDDDDRASRGGHSASGGRRGRGYDDDDGRGWYGDPRGHAEASRRGWEERSFSSRDDDDRHGGHSRGRDEEGRFTSRGGRDDDDYRRSAGRGHGGWFGDSEGHSEAARRGYDERSGASRGRGYPDDDDDGRHGGYRSRGRDEEGRFTSRGGRDEDDDRRGSGRGHGGWFGDPEGHSEAARRGWEDRR